MAILSTVRSSRWCGRGRQGCQLPPEAFPGVRDMKGASARRPAPHFKHYMPLEHFFAEVSQCMPAFVQSACVFGSFVAANAGALNATSRPRANIETSVFIAVSSIADASDAETTGWGCTGFLGASGCRERFRRSDSLSRGGARPPAQNGEVGPSNFQILRASASVGALFCRLVPGRF